MVNNIHRMECASISNSSGASRLCAQHKLDNCYLEELRVKFFPGLLGSVNVQQLKATGFTNGKPPRTAVGGFVDNEAQLL